MNDPLTYEERVVLSELLDQDSKYLRVLRRALELEAGEWLRRLQAASLDEVSGDAFANALRSARYAARARQCQELEAALRSKLR